MRTLISKHPAKLIGMALVFSTCTVAVNAVAADPTYTYINGVKTIVLPSEYKTLKPGTGVTTVTQVCAECHSTDYITTQPNQTLSGWQAVITKMRDKFGMDAISANDEATILNYLVSNYGK